ncbi:MAG: sigma-54-dependent transcriptional regulator [Spirochaetales bacterium]
MAKIVVIDNDELTQVELQAWLGEEHTVLPYEKGVLAVDYVRRERPDLVFLNLHLPDSDAFEIISLIAHSETAPAVVGLISEEITQIIVDAVRRGAIDVIKKPLRIAEIHSVFHRVFSARSMAVDESTAGLIPEIVGAGRATSQLRTQIVRFARSKAPVLILGESGVGKELVARAVHRLSRCAEGRFVGINCSAVPDALFETEMFGTVAGAYTDARTRRGAVEYATNGTLFLDEVGELTPAAQAKLLRVLETGNFSRLGETEERHSNARVVAATNQRLKGSKRFREDLYYRLSVARLIVPPLRDRREDIPALSDYFCEVVSQSEQRRPAAKLTRAALDRLIAHDWPGNIRELKNVIWRSILLTHGHTISADAVQFDL